MCPGVPFHSTPGYFLIVPAGTQEAHAVSIFPWLYCPDSGTAGLPPRLQRRILSSYFVCVRCAANVDCKPPRTWNGIRPRCLVIRRVGSVARKFSRTTEVTWSPVASKKSSVDAIIRSKPSCA